MKILSKIFITLFYLLGVTYLLLPNPQYPDLPSSTLSDEPGDTWQNPDQKAFFTDLERSEVLKSLEESFKLPFLGRLTPSFRLNYRPEESTHFIREQIESYYLEEVIHPFRESLFINGWEPQNAPKWQHIEPDKRPRIQIDKVHYLSKVTLRPVFSPPWARVLVWTFIFPVSYLVIHSLKKSFSK
jgi:hypothetical protein